MISNPSEGFCKFNIGFFNGYPDNTTNVPLELLNAFINYHKLGYGVALIDEREIGYSLILIDYDKDILLRYVGSSEGMIAFKDLKIVDLEEQLIKDIERNLEGWCYFIEPKTKKELETQKNKILTLLEKLKKLREKDAIKYTKDNDN